MTMQISSQLQSQLNRLRKTGAFSISIQSKQELGTLIEQVGGRPYTNYNCGTCTRNAMQELNNFLHMKQSKPVLQMTMDKKPEEMSYIELRKACKNKNIKTGRNPNKQELINLLNNK